jgi:serine/threonine protein kinase/tetratricopeptide (TPR) repeat protein
MGEVYRARDPRLGREVAIKVLPTAFTFDLERLRRFEQEARAASALNHPNILTVHDIGTHEECPYLVCELLHGRTLRDLLEQAPLPVQKAADYARQLTSGLVAAHAKEIIHRDLKPENVFVTDDGRVKILDFGLAKLLQPVRTDEGTGAPAPVSTETGMILGTMGYMSPEQASGERVDHRTDLFSLGAVLYEMVSGRRAFPGHSLAALVAIIHDHPPPVSTIRLEAPQALTQIIQRCLAKDPAERYQSARELLTSLETGAPDTVRPGAEGSRSRRRPLRAALWAGIAAVALFLVARGLGWSGPGGTGGSRIDAVAVLPFVELEASPDSSYLAEGVTDGLIADLAQIGSLKVISRSSGALAEAADTSLSGIAKELGVDVVVKGSILRTGDSARVSVRFYHAADGATRWTRNYQAPLDGLPRLQRDITLAIAGEIDAEVKQDERKRLGTRPEVDQRSYEAYLRGRFHMERGELEQARALFEQARASAPNWAPPYVGLANYYTALPFSSDVPPIDVLPKAREALVRALELDETLAEAHATLAYIRAYYEWDWRAAEREFQRALELRPSYADAHFSYARFLASRDRPDEAMTQIRRAVELDPLSLPLKANAALLSYFAGRYDTALVQLRETLRTDSTDVLAKWGMALVAEQQGRPDEAIAILEPIAGRSLNRISSLGHAYAIAGRVAKARALLDTLHARAAQSYVPSYYYALLHAGLGERDQALQWLERAYQERSTVLAYLRIDPRLRTLHDDPRFGALVRRIRGG